MASENIFHPSMAIKCPIVIFYESHVDKAPAQTITKLIPFLKLKNIKTYAAEEPSGESPQFFIDAMKYMIEQFSFIQSDSNSFNELLENQRKLTNNPELTPKELRELLNNSVDSYAASKKLVESVVQKSFNYVAADVSRDNREMIESKFNAVKIAAMRDQFIVTKLAETCVKYQTGIVLLIGLNHLSIENLLSNKGLNVLSIFTPSLKPDVSTDGHSSIADSDLKVRNGDAEFKAQYQHNIHVLDLYQNPKLNPVAESRKLIAEFIDKTAELHEDIIALPKEDL